MPNISLAYQWTVSVCNAPNVGYSQTYRRGQTVNGITYYDCSSLISAALTKGGFTQTNPWFTTSSMRGYLKDWGFGQIPVTEEWKPGDILWKPGHTEMCYQGYVTMGAHQAGVPLADQVSINSGPVSPTYYTECWRYGGGGATLIWIYGNRYLNQDEMENNAYVFWSTMFGYGWTLNAVAGALGNIQRESTINPGIWQNLSVNPELGFGLVQWTPSTNYTNWAVKNGYDISDGAGQCKWLAEETVPSGQWIPTSSFPQSFEEFTSSTDTPETLAEMFCLNFERAGVAAMDERKRNARNWYNYLENLSPIPPDPGKTVKKKIYHFPLIKRRFY